MGVRVDFIATQTGIIFKQFEKGGKKMEKGKRDQSRVEEVVAKLQVWPSVESRSTVQSLKSLFSLCDLSLCL